MSTAKKLPSGSWRCRVYSHTDQSGKKVYKSFTCSDPTPKGKRKCEAMAAEWAEHKELERLSPDRSMTFAEAVEAYISNRTHTLSPRTIMDYRSTQRNHLRLLMDMDLYQITQADIQKQMDMEAASVSPKTCRNIHGLLSAVMRVYRPEFALNTALPKRQPTNLYIPTESDFKRLLQRVKGTEMEIPVLLAAVGSMRRGEICALMSEDIEGNVIHVHRNMIKTDAGNWIIKSPKSYAGDRYIDMPGWLIEKISTRQGRIVNMVPNTLTSEFIRYVKSCDIPRFRFHDLRHYSASVQHALGVPDSYIMERGGWGSDRTLKSVYRHALSDQSREMSRVTNDYFSKLYDTEV